MCFVHVQPQLPTPTAPRHSQCFPLTPSCLLLLLSVTTESNSGCLLKCWQILLAWPCTGRMQVTIVAPSSWMQRPCVSCPEDGTVKWPWRANPESRFYLSWFIVPESQNQIAVHYVKIVLLFSFVIEHWFFLIIFLSMSDLNSVITSILVRLPRKLEPTRYPPTHPTTHTHCKWLTKFQSLRGPTGMECGLCLTQPL